MQIARVLQYVKPVAQPVERPFSIKYRIGGVACSLSFETEAQREEKAAELVANGAAVVFKPAQI
ncbi:hypothetical protein [Paraburkholderia haematera]|uniref:Uncharacterized protein n=1 Tax=Paraburkholderia haematera TaxID=2793077 RepID=A0ABN7KUD5_9BURK|nr:hypothetical protein [Paraburkholderia haematera]CAE6713709.1 hypothetical protein R69888_01271 [Paraburkholderia haematera]